MHRYPFLSVLLLLCACGADDPAAPATDETAQVAVEDTSSSAAGPGASVADKNDRPGGIDWFDGTVEEAFAAAAAADRPVFLYWGAVWCPPCHAIAATVFKSPQFIERSRLFVPVYLDGDTGDAQAWGEHFGVRGYPTMIVFDPNGEELTRIPGGIDIQAYANVLDLTLGEASPVAEVVDRVLDDDAGLSAADCTLVAFYSWGQDTRILVDADRAAAFRKMHDACPEDSATARSMLYLGWLGEALKDDALATGLRADDEARGRFLAILGSYELVKANLLTILISGPEMAAALTEPGSEAREQAVAALEDVYDRVAADDTVYKRERIYTLIGRIEIERMDDPEAEIPAGLRDRIRDTVTWADESTPSVYERQPIINALANVLFSAGMDDVAKPLLLAELERSKQPYYFMPALADIEQRAGNEAAALEWLKRAHDSARGAATRFQWGYYYIAGLLEMAPEDRQLIHDTTVAVIDELQSSAGFYQRPKSQLGLLEARLLDWGETTDSGETLAGIRESVQAVCARIDTETDARATCESFLKEG